MQLENVITICFFGYGDGQAELQSNRESYRRRYMNAGRHPNLANYEEISITNGAAAPTIATAAHTMPGKAPNAATDRVGVNLIAHGNGGNSEPGAEEMARLMVTALGATRLPLAKINIAVCQGASRLKVLTVHHSQTEFSNSMLKKFCTALKDLAAAGTVTLNPGLLVGSYSVNVETYDRASDATQTQDANGYAFGQPPADLTRVRTVQVNHTDKVYTPVHPQWRDAHFTSSTLRSQAMQQLWTTKRGDNRFKENLKRNPNLDAADVDTAFGQADFATMKAAYAAVAADFERRVAADYNNQIAGSVSSGAGVTAEYIRDVQLYVRNKVALKYEGGTFKPCALSEYTDSARSKEWLDIVTQHMMPKGMSPMGLSM